MARALLLPVMGFAVMGPSAGNRLFLAPVASLLPTQPLRGSGTARTLSAIAPTPPRKHIAHKTKNQRFLI